VRLIKYGPASDLPKAMSQDFDTRRRIQFVTRRQFVLGTAIRIMKEGVSNPGGDQWGRDQRTKSLREVVLRRGWANHLLVHRR
jgi:hypothetical protein